MVPMTICAFFAIALLWSILGFIDTVAITQGQLVTTDRVKLIQPIENGIVRAIHVRDGQRVRQGDVLIELDPTEAQANVDALRADLLKAKLESAATSAILSDDPHQSFLPPSGGEPNLVEATRLQMIGEFEKFGASLASIDAEIIEQEGSLAVLKTQMTRLNDVLPIIQERLSTSDALLRKGLTRRPETQQLQQSYIETASEVEANKSGQLHAQSRMQARLKKKEEIQASFRAKQLQKRADALRRIASLDQQIIKEERRADDRKLRSPIDGSVFGLTVFTVGGVITTKDVVLRIVPAGTQLEAEVVVLNRDIGFVEVGQSVELKLETFPFTRYGLIEGEVKQVWRDAIPDEKQGLIYKAEIRLKADRILIGSRWVMLSPGMSVQAEVKTGERRAIEFLLSPLLRYRDESLRER
jgi:hemolysin D